MLLLQKQVTILTGVDLAKERNDGTNACQRMNEDEKEIL